MGRTDAQKPAFYWAAVAGAAEHDGIKPDDVMIAISGNAPMDWSFGRGDALYASALRSALA
ncbi:MAG: tautomerase family protein [Hyphomicrobiales bacterium]|nr:tautomerase family protein [Hyphomicrobiales bacterium]